MTDMWKGAVCGAVVVMTKGDVTVEHNPTERTRVVSKGGRVVERSFGEVGRCSLRDYLHYVDCITRD